jgi:hypothetical protein
VDQPRNCTHTLLHTTRAFVSTLIFGTSKGKRDLGMKGVVMENLSPKGNIEVQKWKGEVVERRHASGRERRFHEKPNDSV